MRKTIKFKNAASHIVKVCILALLASPGLTWAEGVKYEGMPKIKEFLDFHEASPEEAELYLFGVGRGFWYGVMQYRVVGASPIYCPPEKMNLSPGNYLDLFTGFLAAKHDTFMDMEDKHPALVEAVLIYALMDAFPCPPDEK